MTSATLCSIVSQRLVPLARSLQITRHRAAAGRCLSASLELALLARDRLKIEVELICWRVVDDPRFGEHWAVWLGGGRVLDLTRVQVDGSRQLVGVADEYPVNFTQPRRYPAALLLAAYEAHRHDGDRRLSLAFVRARGRALLRFDLARARRECDLSIALAALREAARFARWGAFDAARRLLERRRRTLLERRATIRAQVDAEAFAPTRPMTNVELADRPRPRRIFS